MFDWLIASIHEPNSPIWLSREVFQNLFAAFLGAAVSAAMIAPMTARWIEIRDAKRWRPGREFVLTRLDRILYDVGASILGFSYDVATIVNNQPKGSVNYFDFLGLKYDTLSESVDELTKFYNQWISIWTSDQNSAILSIVQYLEHIQAEVSGDLYAARKAMEVVNGDVNNADAAYIVRLLQNRPLPNVDVAQYKALYVGLLKSVPDKKLRSIFKDHLNNYIEELDQEKFNAAAAFVRGALLSHWSAQLEGTSNARSAVDGIPSKGEG